MRIYALSAIVAIIALSIGWYTHMIQLADKAHGLEKALIQTQDELADLTAANHALQADHEARTAALTTNLAKLSDDSDCAHHALNWGDGK